MVVYELDWLLLGLMVLVAWANVRGGINIYSFLLWVNTCHKGSEDKVYAYLLKFGGVRIHSK